MHPSKLTWVAVIALLLSLAGCSAGATADSTPPASPTETLVTMAESGKCAETQSRVDVLFAAYEDWLYRLEMAASLDGSGNDLRGYLQSRSQLDIPRELWTTVESGLEGATATLREAIDKPIFIELPYLVSEQQTAMSLLSVRKVDAVIAASRQPPSDTPFLQSLRVLGAFPPYGNALKDFMTSYC